MTADDEYYRPPDCKCGHGQREHKNGKRVTSCERLSCGCTEYRPVKSDG